MPSIAGEPGDVNSWCKHKLVGFVDLGKGHELMNILSGNLHENAYINLK